jgi:uncharacterized protein
MCFGLALLLAPTFPAVAQDRDTSIKRCLSITDVNERVDCLESGGPPSSEATAPNVNLPRQARISPSFDCRTAHASIERAICSDATLSEWDARMGQQFQQALRLAKDSQSLLENQRLWLAQRNTSCGAAAANVAWSCLLEMTRSRTFALANAATTNVEATQTTQPVPPMAPVARVAQPQGKAEPPIANSNLSNAPASNTNTPTSGSGDTSSASWMLIVVLVVSTIVIVRAYRAFQRRRRLVAKYGEKEAALIIAGKVWQGMREEQLTESWGPPVGKSREVIRAKIKETWKYGQTGRNRFTNRIYLEDGLVIGWLER